MNLQQLLAELRSIQEQLVSPAEDADVDALTARANELMEQVNAINAAAEQREATLASVRNAIASGEARSVGSVLTFNAANAGEDTDAEAIYERAFLQRMRGAELNKAEHEVFAKVNSRAGFDGYSTSNSGTVIPTSMANEIIKVAQEHAPLLTMISLVHVPGYVKYTVETEIAEATTHAEGAAISVVKDTTVPIELSAYEITKLVSASDTIQHMSIPAFRTWLIQNLGIAVGTKIEALILNGTGTGEASGLSKITKTADNAITVGKTASLTAQNVLDLIGLLPAAFDANATFVMSKRTFFQDFAGLQDKSKNDLVYIAGNERNILGYPVEFDDRIALHEAVLGDFKAYHGNMPENINVRTSFDIDHNVDKFLGVAMFDGKPAIEKAFVFLTKATA